VELRTGYLLTTGPHGASSHTSEPSPTIVLESFNSSAKMAAHPASTRTPPTFSVWRRTDRCPLETALISSHGLAATHNRLHLTLRPAGFIDLHGNEDAGLVVAWLVNPAGPIPNSPA